MLLLDCFWVSCVLSSQVASAVAGHCGVCVAKDKRALAVTQAGGTAGADGDCAARFLRRHLVQLAGAWPVEAEADLWLTVHLGSTLSVPRDQVSGPALAA